MKFSMMLLLAGAALAGCSSSDDITADMNKEKPAPEQVETPTEKEEPADQAPSEETTPVEFTRMVNLTEDQKSAVTKNNDFAFNFYRAVTKTKALAGKSNVISPLSLTYALGMINAGATGKTAEEITNLLGFGAGDTNAVNQLCSQIIEEAPKTDSQIALGIANCLAADRSLSLVGNYQQVLSRYYQAETATLDFGTKEAVDYVNGWCSRQTDGMIPKIVDELDGVMAVLNAISFKAPWSGKFEVAETTDEPFTKEDRTKAMVPMMHRFDYIYHTVVWAGVKDCLYSMIAMPYGEGKNWRMYVLLPSEGKSVADVLNSLNATEWSKLTRSDAMQYAGEKIDVKIPRFQSASELDLKEVISGMGAPSMFLPRGEFSLISQNYKDLTVGRIKQKAAIEVSEEGSEAAAVTIGVMITSNGSEQTTPLFHCNRPFVYLIQEESSGAVFFIGTYRGE